MFSTVLIVPTLYNHRNKMLNKFVIREGFVLVIKKHEIVHSVVNLCT